MYIKASKNCSERPRGRGGIGRTPVTGPTPSLVPEDEVAGDALDGIHLLHTAALCDILSLGGRSSGTCNRRPIPSTCFFWPYGQRPRNACNQSHHGLLHRKGNCVVQTSPTRRLMTGPCLVLFSSNPSGSFCHSSHGRSLRRLDCWSGTVSPLAVGRTLEDSQGCLLIQVQNRPLCPRPSAMHEGIFPSVQASELRSTGVRQRGGPCPSLQDILNAW
ncbi:hypothetical protein T10_2894 [Trichinella papuae]|uniref:Uncharacterized protein n=1 Tax=Trichinella papuae TaxID=268474 RepID=A0A0V1MZW3_9BILA|nr:hypothetical protein T10_2894 [Trichinella papuae]